MVLGRVYRRDNLVTANNVNEKISASKKVMKREIKKEKAKNKKQDADIARLNAEMEKLKKKKV